MIVTLLEAAVAPIDVNPVPLIVSKSTFPVTVKTETFAPAKVRDSKSVLFVTMIVPSNVAPVARVLTISVSTVALTKELFAFNVTPFDFEPVNVTVSRSELLSKLMIPLFTSAVTVTVSTLPQLAIEIDAKFPANEAVTKSDRLDKAIAGPLLSVVVLGSFTPVISRVIRSLIAPAISTTLLATKDSTPPSTLIVPS